MTEPTTRTPRPIGIEERVEAFEAVCASAAAEIARFLPPVDHPEYLSTLCELIRADLELRRAKGNVKELADYRAEFPVLFAHPDLVEVIAFEQRLRTHVDTQIRGDAPIGCGASSEGKRGSGVTGRPTVTPKWSRSVVPGPPLCDLSGLPRVGEDFLGFRLTEELGTGAFGRVFLAQQLVLSDRPVALKVTARPNREPQHLARLQHTNIVPILSVHQSGELQAVCMPYYGRTTLRHVLSSLRQHDSLPASGEGLVSTLRASAAPTAPALPTPTIVARQASGSAAVPGSITPAPTRDMLARLQYVDAVVWLGARLADGLAHAHERGVLHRDVKPENVLLADDGQPMLLDFNLADDAATELNLAQLGGTLLYMAPEHLEVFCGGVKPVDARSDLYSLGLVLYELLTNRHP